MSNNKITHFLLKRVLVLYVILLIIDLVFINKRWLVLVGLTVGAVIGLFKFKSTALVLSKLISTDKRKNHAKRNILLYVVSQLLVIILLGLAMLVSIWLFAGFTAGILLVPLAIIYNSLTEFFGFTHNNFE